LLLLLLLAALVGVEDERTKRRESGVSCLRMF
jgi:hypothetical protein